MLRKTRSAVCSTAVDLSDSVTGLRLRSERSSKHFHRGLLRFQIRHCYNFGERPAYYVQASLGAEPGQSPESENFSPPVTDAEEAERAFEHNVRQLTQSFQQGGIENTASRLFESARHATLVNGVTNAR